MSCCFFNNWFNYSIKLKYVWNIGIPRGGQGAFAPPIILRFALEKIAVNQEIKKKEVDRDRQAGRERERERERER